MLGLLTVAAIVYCANEWTPSSYGHVLMAIGAPEDGPSFGKPRPIRSDEWSISTPEFVAAVRTQFKRFNETSFYHEDLRSVQPLPLLDWALVFKPQMWAFFIAPPGFAYSINWAFWMWACLAGWLLLLRALGSPLYLACGISLIIFFSGFTQFWLINFVPVIAGTAWCLLIVVSEMRWWSKALLLCWVLPVSAMGYFYPAVIIEIALACLVILIATREDQLRRSGDFASIAIGGVAAAGIISLYLMDVIPVMRASIYPGHRIAAPGSNSMPALLSQLVPNFTFRLNDYSTLIEMNTCELGTIGSFLPLLTVCAMRYGEVWNDRFLRRGLALIGGTVALMSWWQIGSPPAIVGRILQWSLAPAQRLIAASGLLIVFGCVAIWNRRHLSFHPARVILFTVSSVALSFLLKLHEQTIWDYLVCGILILAGGIALLVPAAQKPAILILAVALANVVAFGRFNPLQPGGPIFDPPETDYVHKMQMAQNASPEHILVPTAFVGSVNNGLGFRSVSHGLQMPQMGIFRKYFPTMPRLRFNTIFNRYAHIVANDTTTPRLIQFDLVYVPAEAFEPPRNSRRIVVEKSPQKNCGMPHGGAIERISQDGDSLVIEGWAPWKSETSEQQIHISGARGLDVPVQIRTVRRPDVSETLHDYGYTRCGFYLRLPRAVRPQDIAVVATGTAAGEIVLPGCGCP